MDRKPKVIPDGSYATKNNKLEIPLHNYNRPLRVPEHINFGRIIFIKTRDEVSESKGDEVDGIITYIMLRDSKNSRKIWTLNT